MNFINNHEAYTSLIEKASDGQFPLDVFPQGFHTATKNMTREGEFRIEYVAMAMLSALASTVGNAFSLEIRDGFRVNPALMMTFVGKPGAGKTPPLMAAYDALRRSDHNRYVQWRQALHDYNVKQKTPSDADCTGTKRPVCRQAVISDFTQEAMVSQLENNPQGVAIVVDEIAGFFNTVNRYNSSNMIETLLSAFSGEVIKVNRKGPDGLGQVISVVNPSINLIGTIQPSLLYGVLFRPLQGNGFLDRMCFVYPECGTTTRWSGRPGYAENKSSMPNPAEPATPSRDFERWGQPVRHVDPATLLWEKIHSAAENLSKNEPRCLRLSMEAQKWFYQWRDDLMEMVDETDEAQADSRVMKRVAIIGKIALLLHLAKVAAGEQQIHVSVSKNAIMGAVAINEWLEWSYRRVKRVAQETTGRPSGPSQKQMESWAFVANLPEAFSFNDAITAGKKHGKGKTWIKEKLLEMVEASALVKVSRGNYRKASLLQ
ncbi:MAG: DUF3987 domain-containing protein [Bacteroidales bacterium]|nr:DUF3987 domain-containing protein [Bacteroidales bacterium]